MFEKDELIMCGGHGVCRVVDIVGNPIDRLDKKRKYYLLEPVFEKGSTIYTPVDNDKVIMRKIMNKEEAEELLYSDMSLALSIPKEEVEEYITQAVDKQ